MLPKLGSDHAGFPALTRQTSLGQDWHRRVPEMTYSQHSPLWVSSQGTGDLNGSDALEVLLHASSSLAGGAVFLTLAPSAWWEQMPTPIACSWEDGVMYLAGKEVLCKGFI